MPEGLIIIAIAWSLVPAFICASVAGKRQLVPGAAVLLGLLGGWLGVAIVAAFYKSPLIEPASKPHPDSRMGPALGSTSLDAPAEDDAIRLRRLQALRDEGLINEAEFEERRREILGRL